MKKSTLLASIILSTALLSACGSGGTPEIKQNYGNGETGPQVKGLKVADCNGLTADLQKGNPKVTKDEAYKGAADILFSNARPDEAKTCCDKITDAAAKKECRRE